ncbi:unnamed protein product [Malus baccata var. baccata]
MDTSTSSSSSSKGWNYDVYLSSGGEDTRKNFTDHLYFALKDAGVNVFVDDDLQRRGAIMDNELFQVIKGSAVAVIVFSRRYAESSWCLDELAKIMECRRTLGQLVFPIFYDVDPSDVSNQTGSFATAFKKQEQRAQAKKKLQLWRNALTEAANSSGFVFGDADGYEGKFIREIVTRITTVCNRIRCLTVASYQVGIDYRVQDIDNYLAIGESNDVRRIGIWGMGGMGKTTVAKAIFNKYQDMFEGKSFLPNVRTMELVKLQEQLLFDILKPANTRVSCVDEGIHEIKRRLHNRRVLVIVDEIDHMKQLKALVINYDSFGPGSRIIITTRDQHLLEILKVDGIYKLPPMNRAEASQLLSRHAFRRNYPKNEYLQVSREVVDYCGGLPLALEVLGSYLCARSTSEWKSALEKLKFHPDQKILKSLKISFDELDDYDLKTIFLDISCFFTGMIKDYVVKILDGCGLYPEIGITVLQERCLVTVDHNLKLVMHDLLRDMGREIVRLESSEPGERSRLWHHDDVIDVLKNESGTEAIRGLTLDLQESDKASFSTEAFRNMQSLRLLKLNYVKLTGSYNNLPNELRWLCWHGFPLDVIPKDFDHPNMVAIDLSYSKLIQVWENSDLLLEKLKFLNLSHSHYLTQSPDFSKIPNLERLILQDCKCLLDIDQSIGQLEKLVSVDLQRNSFCRLPSLGGISKLETLCLNNCTNLSAIPDLPTSLEILEADECIALEKMPDFSEMSRMRVLHLNHSPKLTEIPGLHNSLKSMTMIHMEGCKNLTADFRKKILQGWTSCGYGGIFLDGYYMPEWFRYYGANAVSVVVPQSVGSNFKGLTLFCIYSSRKQPEDCPLGISIRNKTKHTALLARITYASVPTSCDSEDYYLWQGQLSNDVLSWQDGDEVKIFVGPVGPGDNSARVRIIAVDLVWDKFMKENMDDSHPGLYDLNPHQDCLSGDNDEARTSCDVSDENLPAKTLRSDDVNSDIIDGVDENRTPKKLKPDSASW